MAQEDLIQSLNSRLNPDALLGSDPVVAQGEDSEEFEAQKRIAERRRIEDREQQYQKSLQANRDLLGSIASPVERKRLESFYSIEQKRAILDGRTVEKRYGLDGFKKMRIDFMDDGDSGYLVDEKGKRYAFRSSSGGSIRFDAPDYKEDVERSRYKFGIQPQAVARAYGKSINELTDEDYANYEAYAQAESVKRLTATTPYQSERFDPNKKYQKLNPMGLEVYARMEGKDMYDRYLATIYNPATGQDLGYDSGLDPNVNSNFSLFNSLATRGNYQRSLDAQRMGEYFRDQVEPENGYVDPDATTRRWYREYGKVYNDDSLPVAALRQLGSSALSTLGNIGVAITESPDKQEGKEKPYFNLRKYADKEMADMLLGQSDARRQEYADYMNNVSSKFESGDITGGLWEFLKHPTQVWMFAAEQLGNMTPGLLATIATGGAGIASFGAATATDLLANIGMDFMEFRKNHGRSMNAEEMAKAYIRQLPAAVLDAVSDKIVVGNTNLLKTARYTPIRAVGQVAKEMGVEGTQEVTQNIASLMNSEDKSFDEALKDPSNVSNFMLGALGGGLMSAPVGTGQVARHMVQSAAFQQFKEKYKADHDQQAADAGDTLASDHRQQRENFISSTLDSYQQAKDAGDSTAMFGSIASLKTKLDDTKSGLSAYDKEHIKATLYDVVNDTIGSLVKDGAMDSATESVLNQLKDSLGIQDNEQLKKDLAKYAEVYGSSSEGRLATQNDTYENEHDRQAKAEQFETLIQNLGGTKAEARKLLEEVAEENINDKNEGFNSSLAKAKQAQEEGNTEVYNNEVSHMTDRVKSMVMKMQELTEGLRSNMNKGATTDSRGFLSDDKFSILYGNEKDSGKRGEKAQFRTSFKKEAFNYSTRGGLFKTTDQIAAEARYMAEQLDSLNLSDKQKTDIKQQLDLLQEYENDINHMGYELHKGIRGGFNYEADTDGEAVLSEGETAKIKGAMEDYFHQYVTPNTGEKRLSPKEAVDLKKYVNTLSLGQLKAFQKSLDKQKDSIAYEGVSAAIKSRESTRGIATSHNQWRSTHYQNGQYIRSLVKTTQTTEKGNEAKIDNMVNGTHVDAINNANILEAHHEQLQQRIAKLEAKQNRTNREEKKLNELKAKLKNTKERLDTLERVSDARAKTIYKQYVKKVLEYPAQLSNLIAEAHRAYVEQDAKVNVRAIEKAVKMLRDTLHDASSMETDKAKLKDAQEALELLDKILKRAEKTDRVLEGRDTLIHKLIDMCSKENLRTLSDINFLKALKQSMEKFKDKLGDRLEAYKGPYKEALYNLAYKIRLIERNDEKLVRGIIYDINHNGDLDDLKSRAADYEKKIAKLQTKKSLSSEEQKTLDRYKQYTSAIAKQTKKLEDRANEFENKLPDRPDIFAIENIDELEELDRTIINSLSQLYDPKSEFYGNKLAIQKVMEVRKDIQARIAELSEKQDASESLQNGSESTETGQSEQFITETQESSQNGSEGSETVSEEDTSEELNTEEKILSTIDRYTSEFDDFMSSEEIENIIDNLNDQLDVIDNSNNEAIKRHWDTVESLINSYKHLLEDVRKRENQEAIEDANSLFSDEKKADAYYSCQDILDAYSDVKEGLSADEYASIADKIFDAFSSTLKYSESEFKELDKQLRNLYDTYRETEDTARSKEGWKGLTDEQVKLQETIEELRDRLINTGKRKDGKTDTDANTNVIGEMLFSQWNRDAKLKVFAEKYKIADLSDYFKLKAAAMSLDAGDGRNAEALKELKAKAVELLSGAVMQMSERIVPYTKRDKDNGKPDPRTLGRIDSKTGTFKPYSSWNDILSNMFRNNPHLQILFAPDVYESPKSLAFTSIQSVKMNDNVAAGILLAVLEFFANRSVSPLFNPQSRDEIAAAFGTTSEAADPAVLDTYAKVSRKWGVFKGTISSTIGRMIMDNLGLGRSSKLSKKLVATYPNAVAALGDLGLVMAEQLGLVTVTDVYTGELPNSDADNYAEEKARYDRCAHLNELGLTRGDASNLGLGNAKIRHFYKFNDTKETDEKLKSMWLGPMTGVDENGQPIMSNGKIERDEDRGFKQFKTGVDTLTRTPKLSAADIHNKSGRRKQEEFKLTPDRMEVLNEASKAPYYINSPILHDMLDICGGNLIKLRSALLKRMGHKDIVGTKEFSKLSYDEQQKIKGKNESLEREVDYLLDYWKLQDALTEAKEFDGYYFEFFGSANNRSFLDSNTINPQTAKTTTRFLMQPKTTEQQYKLDSRDTIEKELFAVAQAFDCLKDYYNSGEFKNKGISLAGKLLGLDVIGNLKEVEKRLALLKELRKDLLLNDQKTNKKIYKKELGWGGKVENFGQVCVAIDHCIRRLESIANNGGEAKGAKRIKSYLSVENDSTTSGYVIKFLLMPLDEQLLMDYGPKVGFLNPVLIDNNPNFSPEFKANLKSYTSIDQLKADPDFLDIYKTGAVEMIAQYNKMKESLKDRGMSIGDDVYQRMCQKENKNSRSEEDKYISTRLGEHLLNSGMSADSITKGFNIINPAIPHPEQKEKGRWTVSSVLRNLMKPIIMIFGYNASDDSCRKRFAEAVMDEHISDFLKLYHNGGLNIAGTEVTATPKGVELIASDPENITDEDIKRANAIAKFMFGAAVRVTGVVDNRAQALKEFAKQLSEKSPYAIRFLPAEKGVSINETLSLAEWYQLTIGGTYGQAVTNFLSEKFGIYGKANRALNNVSRSMFKIYSFFRTKLLEKKFTEMTDLDDGTTKKASTNSVVQRLRSKYRDKLHFTNHSGGAYGSDTYWGDAGKKYQVVSRHYYLGTTSKYNAPNGNIPLTEREMAEGKDKATAAGYAMGRLTAGKVKSPQLIRNWNQVKYSDAIFAVANGFIKKGENISDDRIALTTQVKGGTGWAVQMAITEGKPVYVYIQQGRDTGWYRYDPDVQDFVKMLAMPMLTPNFAGIGTRRLNRLGIKAIDDLYSNTFIQNGRVVPDAGMYIKLQPWMLNISDLTGNEVNEIDKTIKPLFPMFPAAGIDMNAANKEKYYIRSVENASLSLDGSSAYTEMWKKDSEGNYITGYATDGNPDHKLVSKSYDSLNSYGDLNELSPGMRMLAVLMIHFTDGVLAQKTMNKMLSAKVKRFLTVVHDAFVLSAKNSNDIGKAFNEALYKVCMEFNPFEMINELMGGIYKDGTSTGLRDVALKMADSIGISKEEMEKLFDEPLFSHDGTDIKDSSYDILSSQMGFYGQKSRQLKETILSPQGRKGIVIANLGGDVKSSYKVTGQVEIPVSKVTMSTPTVDEKEELQEKDALGSRASAWKDKYDIENIEQEANSSKEGRAKIFQSLNEWDEAEGPVKNDKEYLKQAQELLNEINPERFTNLQYEEAVSQQDAEAKGVYFTGKDGSQRRVTVIKPTAIANEADRKNRLASRQLSAAAVYMHEMIHPAVSEAVANPDMYGVTREVSALREFYDAVANKLNEMYGEHPEQFFRPDNYDSLTEAEKKLADESAKKYYDYMFNSTDKDTLGGFQEFIANALSDPRMIELLKGMDASAYSEEYRGKNFFEKIFYIVKHIFKAMFGNEESKGKVLRTMGTLGLESKRQGSIYDAMRNLTVQISYANAYAANKMQNNKLSKLENVFEALNSAAQVIKPVNDFVSDKIKWAFDLGGVSNRFERTYKSLEDIIKEQGIVEGSNKMDTLKALLLCPFSHNMRVALADTLIDCCSLGQRSTFAHFIRDISDKDEATQQLEGLASLRNNIDRMSRGAGAAYAANILDAFGGTISDEDSIACTKVGVACDLQSLLTNGYSIEEIQKLASGEGIEEAIASHEAAIAKFYENDKDGEMKTIWTRNQCIGLAHFMNTNKGNPAQCLNAYAIARGFLCSKKNKEADEKLIGHIDCLASLIAMQNADPSHRLAISKMNSKGLKTVLECHRSLIGKAFDAGYIERAHMIKGWHSSIIDDTKDYAVAPVDPATVKTMADDGYKLNTQLPVDGMTNAVMGFYIKNVTTPQHRQGAALQITGRRAIGQSLNSFMESNEHIIGDRRDYITKQIKKAHFIRTKMQEKMENLNGLSYEDFDNRGMVGSYYTPVISPTGEVTDFRITMFNDFKDAVMNRNNNICDVMSKMAMTNTVKTSAGGQNTNIVHFLIDDMEKNMDKDTHRAKRQFENLSEVMLGSRDFRNKHDIKYVRVRIDPDSEFAAPDVPAAIIPEEMREAMRRLEKNGDGLWVREDWLYQIFGTPDISLADAKVMQKENMRAARFGIRLAENIAKAVATLAKVAIVFKKPQVLIGNVVSNYLFHIMNGHNPVTAAAMDTENLQLVVKYMQMEKEINRLDIKRDIGEATESEKARLNRLRSALENNPIHKLVQAGLFSAVVEDNSKKDQDAMKAMLRYISDNPKMQKIAKSALGDAFDMKTIKGKIAGQLYMREGTPLYDFIYAMTQYSDFVSRCTDYRIGMKQMPKAVRDNAEMKKRYETVLIRQIRDDYINYDSPQSKAMNYINAVGLTFFTKYFFRIQRVIRRTTTRRPLMAFSMFAANAHFDTPDNIFEQMPLSKNYGAIFHTPWGNAADLVFPPAFGAYNPANWWPF